MLPTKEEKKEWRKIYKTEEHSNIIFHWIENPQISSWRLDVDMKICIDVDIDKNKNQKILN